MKRVVYTGLGGSSMVAKMFLPLLLHFLCSYRCSSHPSHLCSIWSVYPTFGNWQVVFSSLQFSTYLTSIAQLLVDCWICLSMCTDSRRMVKPTHWLICQVRHRSEKGVPGQAADYGTQKGRQWAKKQESVEKLIGFVASILTRSAGVNIDMVNNGLCRDLCMY